jgi:hypothetical protein
MKVWKIRQYLPALLLYIQRRVGGERGFLVAVRTRDICGVDRRCGRAVHSLMMSLVEKGLAKRHKKGTYLIERRAVEEVLTALEGVDMTTAAKKIKTTAAVFELPQKLGILQYVEYEPPPKEWCTSEGCLYEGLLTAEGCRKGVCVKYRVWVHSRDRRRWEAKEKWRRRSEEAGGCIRQQVADALWELSDRFDVGVWYEYVRVGVGVNQYDVFCGVVVNGIRLDQPHCRAVDECVEEILRDYKRELERLREPPEPALVIKIDPVEELLREWPELGAFGTDWVRKWLDLRERLVEIAKVMRRFPWMVEVIRQRPMSILHPYMVEVYVAKDGSEACISLTSSKAFCAQNGAVREVKLELEFKRYETYEDKIREVYRPKGLLAYTTAAREYVKLI